MELFVSTYTLLFTLAYLVIQDSVCGDGMKASDEGCDDGGAESGDGCSSECTVEAGFECDGMA